MEQQVNLFQPIMGAEKRLFSAHTTLAALGLLVVLLAALAGFGAWRTTRAEQQIAALEREQGATLDMATRASASIRPRNSLAEIEAEARELSAQVAAHDRALDLVRQGGGGDARAGFAARLEALAQPAVSGLWLRNIRLRASRDGVALRGGTVDPTLVPGYIALLSAQPAMSGVHFDRLSIRQAEKDEAPASLVFELDAPDFDFKALEHKP